MRESFNSAFQHTIGLEGGYTNDKNDTGHETNFGIVKRWHPDEDIKNMTIERAKEIYLAEYWIPCGGDTIEYPLDCIVFDTAVNMGVGTAKVLLNRSAGDVGTYLELRRQRYDNIVVRNPAQKRFLAGWYNRIAKLKELYLS
jgi:lysozyme family protein